MEHVSIFARKKSPYWYIAYFDTKLNKRVPGKSTKIRIDDPLGRRKVLDLAKAHSQEAKAMKPILNVSAWENWAEKYLRDHYADSPPSLARALNAWRPLQEWLHTARIPAPSVIEYKHVRAWVDWRTSQLRRNGKKISHNTALTDFGYLVTLMREAVRLDFIRFNPLLDHGIRRKKVKEKPEITDRQDAHILAKLVELKKPQWMHDSYAVGMAQGCRLREVETSMDDIDEVRGVITFNAKGDKRFATKLHSSLLPIIARRRAEEAKVLVELPAVPAKEWCFFFDEIGLPEHSFHCTRVTVITKLARAGVPVQQAMAYVGHASETIHRIYQRLLPQDLARATDAISRPAGAVPPEASKGLESKTRSQQAA